jgi:PAS domain-containing protein
LWLQHHRLDIAVSNMMRGVLLFDSSHRRIICNQRYIKMFRVSLFVEFDAFIAHRIPARAATRIGHLF